MRVRVEVGIYDQPLEVPASLGSMGRTQMLELLGGTRFAVDRRKGWVNRDVEERLVQEGATPAGQMRVPPPPPTPSGRTGPVPPQPSSAPAVRPPPAPPSRGRSPWRCSIIFHRCPEAQCYATRQGCTCCEGKDKGNARSCKEHIASTTSRGRPQQRVHNRLYFHRTLLLLRR